ncbi:deoxyribose-phosphate aldolase [Pilibacter termitis]|uniref:Deoxyribose-phosphate aldolase n=1 Tax=Pilibacter termitis TaxID=263852 RepID=A0A1T4PW64_9ENTE|nr:hypothetical protein [Pilibacter termitis]SJZ95709.1 deoxyribose-phosphate aldolase [Pilibacter termitis]
MQRKLLIKADMTDDELKETLLNLDDRIEEVFVLPNHLTRAKQLLYRREIKLASLIDYPLGCGTTGKIAFEVGESFRLGAEILQISLPIYAIKEQNFDVIKNLCETLFPLGATRELRFCVENTQLREIDKIKLAQNISSLNIRHLTLHVKNIENALHDISVFQLDAGEEVTLHVNVQELNKEKLPLLYKTGIKRVGAFIL